MKFSNAILCQQTDEVKATDRVFPSRRRKDRAGIKDLNPSHTHIHTNMFSPKVGVECLKLRKVAVEGRDISCTNTAECTDFENIT